MEFSDADLEAQAFVHPVVAEPQWGVQLGTDRTCIEVGRGDVLCGMHGHLERAQVELVAGPDDANPVLCHSVRPQKCTAVWRDAGQRPSVAHDRWHIHHVVVVCVGHHDVVTCWQVALHEIHVWTRAAKPQVAERGPREEWVDREDHAPVTELDPRDAKPAEGNR